MRAVHEPTFDAIETSMPGRHSTIVVQRGANPLMAGGTRLLGAAMVLAAIGMWSAIAAPAAPYPFLARLVMSVVLLCIGLVMMQPVRRTGREEVHLDAQARELRHVRRGPDGRVREMARFAFDDLGGVSLRGNRLVVWGQDGVALIEMPLVHATDIDDLRALLRRGAL
ncbi:hypothetical protein [Sediminimonas sp.]|uniref:hypothetical protein n=1 Tax=Sediminimonas sp. TaxID=2823379 RepID=UPI0025D9A0D6|nr:hypothetical protein [Sediminimonas sp.]